MEKIYDFVIKLKKWPPGNHGKRIFFLKIEIVATKIVNSKSLKKICRQLLSTMNVLNAKHFVQINRTSLGPRKTVALL